MRTWSMQWLRKPKKQGMNVEVVEFSDYITPDKALAEGDLDLNSYQHAPFLNTSIPKTIPNWCPLATLS